MAAASTSDGSSGEWVRPATYVEGFHDEDAVRKMEYRILGKTGRNVSVLALGASALGGVFGVDAGEAEARSIVTDTIKAGVNVVDTAPWYGHGKSETVLGKALSGVPRAAYFMHTKVGRYEADVETMFDFRAERVERSIEESIARLGCEYLDLAQVHDPEFAPNLRIIVEQTIPALVRMRDRGKIRGIGITGYPIGMLKELAEACTAASLPIDTCLSYCRLNLQDSSFRSSGILDEMVSTHGLGVINAAPIGMGLLSERGPQSWHAASPEVRDACKHAAEDAAAAGSNISKLAMIYCLRQSGVSTTMVSTPSYKLAMDNVAYANKTLTLTDEEEVLLATLRSKYFEPLEAAGKQHWEGVEIQGYWASLGKRLWTRATYPAYA
jgi:aryl-alcohol dehydrogenase-like predicted oxidoreductase